MKYGAGFCSLNGEMSFVKSRFGCTTLLRICPQRTYCTICEHHKPHTQAFWLSSGPPAFSFFLRKSEILSGMVEALLHAASGGLKCFQFIPQLSFLLSSTSKEEMKKRPSNSSSPTHILKSEQCWWAHENLWLNSTQPFFRLCHFPASKHQNSTEGCWLIES